MFWRQFSYKFLGEGGTKKTKRENITNEEGAYRMSNASLEFDLIYEPRQIIDWPYI